MCRDLIQKPEELEKLKKPMIQRSTHLNKKLDHCFDSSYQTVLELKTVKDTKY